jgi:uncharacterized membrane protein YgcG
MLLGAPARPVAALAYLPDALVVELLGLCAHSLPELVCLRSVCRRWRRVFDSAADRLFNAVLVRCIAEARWHTRYTRVDMLVDAGERAVNASVAGLDTNRAGAQQAGHDEDDNEGDDDVDDGEETYEPPPDPPLSAPAAPAPLTLPGAVDASLAAGAGGDGASSSSGGGSSGGGGGSAPVAPAAPPAPLTLSLQAPRGRRALTFDVPLETPSIAQQASAALQEDRLGVFDYGEFAPLHRREVRCGGGGAWPWACGAVCNRGARVCRAAPSPGPRAAPGQVFLWHHARVRGTVAVRRGCNGRGWVAGEEGGGGCRKWRVWWVGIPEHVGPMQRTTQPPEIAATA